MKHLIKLISLLVVVLTFPLSGVFAQNNLVKGDSVSLKTGDLIIRINEFDSDEGEVKIALNNSEENYNEGKAFRATVAKITDANCLTNNVTQWDLKRIRCLIIYVTPKYRINYESRIKNRISRSNQNPV